MANAVLEPLDLSLPNMKELGAKWLTGMAEYLAANPQFVVNGFIRSGVTHALDHNIVESPITNGSGDDDSDDEDSYYQVDSDSEEDLNDEDGLDDKENLDAEGLDNEECLDEEDLDDEEGPDNDEEEHLESPDDPEGVGQSDEMIIIDRKQFFEINIKS